MAGRPRTHAASSRRIPSPLSVRRTATGRAGPGRAPGGRRERLGLAGQPRRRGGPPPGGHDLYEGLGAPDKHGQGAVGPARRGHSGSATGAARRARLWLGEPDRHGAAYRRPVAQGLRTARWRARFPDMHTVAFHLRHIFWKLGITSRMQRRAWSRSRTPRTRDLRLGGRQHAAAAVTSAVFGRNRVQQRRHRRSGQPAGAPPARSASTSPPQMPCWPPDPTRASRVPGTRPAPGIPRTPPAPAPPPRGPARACRDRIPLVGIQRAAGTPGQWAHHRRRQFVHGHIGGFGVQIRGRGDLVGPAGRVRCSGVAGRRACAVRC